VSGVFIGTDGFAAGVLQRLSEAGDQSKPELVITRPDSPKGRGRKLSPPPVAETAAELGIAVLQPEDIGSPEVAERIDSINPPALSLCAYGAIIREPLLSTRPILNLHPSLLPRWRGAAPIERALMAGDSETGVSIIQLVEALDAGPMALQERIEIHATEDFATLSGRLIDLGARLLTESLLMADVGSIEFSPQPSEGETYAERIVAADRILDQIMSATDAERKIRALRPHIGARLMLPSGDFLGVREGLVADTGLLAGEVREVDGELLAGFSSGALRITRLIPAGGREMDASEWLRGSPELDRS